MTAATPLADWIAARPALQSVQVALSDINGVFRGKRLPASAVAKALDGQMRMPLTVAALDIWGRDVAGSPYLTSGDADGLCRPTGRAPLALDWHDPPSALLPVWSFEPGGGPSPIDARHALARVQARAATRGLTPVVGTEIEFHFIDPAAPHPAAPAAPATGRPTVAEGICAIADLDGFDPVLTAIFDAAAAADIPLESGIAEAGRGQFEIALGARADALAAADDLVLLKHLIRGQAQCHGLAATFMAKPYADRAGNGLHVHLSLRHGQGRNIFDDGTERGADPLGQAVAGCLAGLAPMMLIYAPHLNSYRRITPEAHAPVAADWGYDNRFTALRIPGGPPAARRLEHRVAGADANPYLVIAAVLSAALDGIEAGQAPPAPESGGPSLATTWGRAIDAFRAGPAAQILGQPLAEIFADCKAQEHARFAARMTDFEIDTYRESV